MLRRTMVPRIWHLFARYGYPLLFPDQDVGCGFKCTRDGGNVTSGTLQKVAQGWPRTSLSWPILGLYAFAVDWGDSYGEILSDLRMDYADIHISHNERQRVIHGHTEEKKLVHEMAKMACVP
jgi:hypothetical protein